MAKALRRPHAPDSELAAAQQALAHYLWEEARERFAALLEREELAEAREGLGLALCWLGEIPAALEQFETSFRLFRERGDHRGAARLALAQAVEHIGSLGADAVGNGWLARAHRELEGLEPGGEQAWLAIWEAHIAFLYRNDLEAAHERLGDGLAIARSLGLSEIESFGIGLEGLAMVAEGRVEEGLRRLDEATAAAVSGEIQGIQAIGQAYCYVMRACEQVHDFERAAQWVERAREISRRLKVGYFESFCRNHYAAVLLWRGAWAEAEAELEALGREMAGIAPTILPVGTARLGELRRRQGRLEDAAELFARSEAVPESTLGRAALALDRGDPAAAVELAERYFRILPAEDRIGRAPAWALLARAHSAQGRADAAAEAHAHLRQVAAAAATEELRGIARSAEGVLAAAAGDVEGARDAFEDAVVLFERTACPYEAGRARLDLARALLALDRRPRAEEEARAARRQLARIGAAGEVARADELLAEIAAAEDAEAGRPTGAPTPGGLTPRQLEVLRWVAQGLSNREIGERMYLSEFTVKRHVADILTGLDLPTRAAAAAWAVREELV